MTTEPSKIIAVPAPGEDFSLGPYLDVLFRWTETQSWFQAQAEEAWHAFSHLSGPLPDPMDPDQHDRLLRFWAWFTLDRPGTPDGKRPIEAFREAHQRDLTAEGSQVFAELAETRYGVYRVQQTVPGRLAVLEDMATGDRFRLHERALTSELQKGDLVVGRLYPHGDAYLADPDVHIGHVSEAPQDHRIDAPGAEERYFTAMVPAKGHVLDVLDALLLQVDSPLTADDVAHMIRTAESLEQVLDELFAAPGYRMRYLHMRDRALLDELLNELWDTTGPLQEAELRPEDAAALTRATRAGLRAIAEGDEAALAELMDPKSFLPLYLELFGMKGLQRLADVSHGAPGAAVRPKHQLLPKDGGIFSVFVWEREGERHAAGLVSYAGPAGEWRLADISAPEQASHQAVRAFERASQLGWAAATAADPVEAHLRRAVDEVGYAVHDAIDLFRLWREFKAAAQPDLAQPAIWAAGVELAECRFRNEDPDVKVLSKSYGVFPRAIEQAAQSIEDTLKALPPER